MSLADEYKRYQQALTVAKQLGLPPPEPPDAPTRERVRRRRPRPEMPEVPEQARGASKRGVRSRAQLADLLWSKAVQVGVPVSEKAGMIPYTRIPESIRKRVSARYKERGEREPAWGGWDPRTLEPAERALLMQLMAKEQRATPELSPEEQQRLARRMMNTERSVKLDQIRAAEAAPWKAKM